MENNQYYVTAYDNYVTTQLPNGQPPKILIRLSVQKLSVAVSINQVYCEDVIDCYSSFELFLLTIEVTLNSLRSGSRQ